MEFFDKESEMRYIKEELKKTDEFYKLFKYEFAKVLVGLIKDYFPEVHPDSELDQIISVYATEILNSTESVIDKDRIYMDYRLEEELDNMNRLVSKVKEFRNSSEFLDAVHEKVKLQMVKYFEDIFELSATGFRLLERNAKLYNLEFAGSFQTFTVNQMNSK